MSALFLSIAIALLGGIAIGFQNPIAGFMGDRIGLLQSAFIIHIGGTILAGILLLAIPGATLAGWRQLPWYAFGAGALGVVLVGSIGFTIPRIGVAPTVGFIVAAQLTIGLVLDHFGMLGFAVRSFDASKLAGVGFLVVGAWLILRR